MIKQGKIWGETTLFFDDSKVSIHYLKIKKNGYCSEHKHKYKSNIFFVIKGRLQVDIWRDGTVDKTILQEGDRHEVLPGIFHRFKALTDVECLEVYEAKLRGEDIERRIEGGMSK